MKLKDKKVDELLELCKHNHAQAQMEVYDRYHQAMFIIALKIVHNKMDAKDIMQEGFLTAFNRIDQYKGENNFGGLAQTNNHKKKHTTSSGSEKGIKAS
ncbi:MAG: sigma-70 family RNA polymerase sigma factor [Flavobacteriaceae bacterium]|nr:sigma-70 family RNA polymerase sigma factor [Flavobacteriaceae bacterium]